MDSSQTTQWTVICCIFFAILLSSLAFCVQAISALLPHTGADIPSASLPADRLQALSKTYLPRIMPSDGKTEVVLAQFPFTTTGRGTLAVTSLNTLFIDGLVPGRLQIATLSMITCSVRLDQQVLASVRREWRSAPLESAINLATTTILLPGKHLLVLACRCLLAPVAHAADLTMRIESAGMVVTVIPEKV